mmetsp:Transcript_43210/g.74588  ORF Transcript_43210/g.74588 Transcript_43210/m.74588 type:complete len:247 (-) Transcript_43210:806-1546(-)
MVEWGSFCGCIKHWRPQKNECHQSCLEYSLDKPHKQDPGRAQRHPQRCPAAPPGRPAAAGRRCGAAEEGSGGGGGLCDPLAGRGTLMQRSCSGGVANGEGVCASVLRPGGSRKGQVCQGHAGTKTERAVHSKAPLYQPPGHETTQHRHGSHPKSVSSERVTQQFGCKSAAIMLCYHPTLVACHQQAGGHSGKCPAEDERGPAPAARGPRAPHQQEALRGVEGQVGEGARAPTPGVHRPPCTESKNQ